MSKQPRKPPRRIRIRPTLILTGPGFSEIARKQGNYVEKVERLNAESRRRPGQLREVFVMHDDWCGVFKGKPCHCDPVVKYREDVESPDRN